MKVARLASRSPALWAILLLPLLVAAIASGVTAGERHAGTVLAVDSQARTLTVDELGANAVRRALRVQVPREAAVVLSRRNQSSLELKDNFRDSSISLGDVRVGDFVVVELSDDPEIARLVMVTLRRGAGS
ncbi:MAG: hypothetical protein ACREJY_02140 [Candidatus Rokuibacteriota bacterium]